MDPRLENVKNQVLATANLKATFDNAVNFINQFLNEKKLFGSSANKGNQVWNGSSTNTCHGNHGDCNHGHGNRGLVVVMDAMNMVDMVVVDVVGIKVTGDITLMPSTVESKIVTTRMKNGYFESQRPAESSWPWSTEKFTSS
jgi:hypothetical protein